MGEGKAQTTEQGTEQGGALSTPEMTGTYMGGEASTPDVNTNIDPNMQGGSATPADREATQEINRQHVQDTTPD